MIQFARVSDACGEIHHSLHALPSPPIGFLIVFRDLCRQAKNPWETSKNWRAKFGEDWNRPCLD
ncbi:MAG: hypothetical protein VB143_03525, partial [Burkholderia sp.]